VSHESYVEEGHELKSNYAFSSKNSLGRGSNSGPPKRRETKIYEEIKKYFEEKYCKYKENKDH
jgi:hypothetical protein